MTDVRKTSAQGHSWRGAFRRPEVPLEIAILTLVGVLTLAISAVVVRRPVPSFEIDLFQAVNGLPASLNTVVWPLMQYGTFLTIPVLALVAFALRRARLAIAMLIAGIGVYVIAKLVKGIVDRGRPGAILPDVVSRETFAEGSLGFPSGHAAVAAALTCVIWRHLGRRAGLAALALAVVVGFGRMYVGAHLPLDIVGGAALGAVAGSIANVLVPPARETPDPMDTDEDSLPETDR